MSGPADSFRAQLVGVVQDKAAELEARAVEVVNTAAAEVTEAVGVELTTSELVEVRDLSRDLIADLRQIGLDRGLQLLRGEGSEDSVMDALDAISDLPAESHDDHVRRIDLLARLSHQIADVTESQRARNERALNLAWAVGLRALTLAVA